MIVAKWHNTGPTQVVCLAHVDAPSVMQMQAVCAQRSGNQRRLQDPSSAGSIMTTSSAGVYSVQRLAFASSDRAQIVLITLLVQQPCIALQATGGGQRLKLLEVIVQKGTGVPPVRGGG